MNVNKKLGRLRHWAGEKMGGEVKTDVSDDFKSLEVEMGLRQDGMDRLQKSMTSYVKTLSKRNEGDGKDKLLPVAYLGSTMVSHGEDFEDDSEFGQCLQSMGRTNERIGRIQETYVADATSSWLESLDRSMVQMKEYQAARKKLESRRLAYDTCLAKMQKAKKEDFRVEEELRSQKAKYEETSEDVYRRMQDIKEAEADSVADLGTFLEAELKYYDRCREILLNLKREWPAKQYQSDGPDPRREPRSRNTTAHSYADRYAAEQEVVQDTRPAIRSNRTASGTSPPSASRQISYGYDEVLPQRPANPRATTFQGPTQIRRDASPMGSLPMARTPSDSIAIKSQRAQLKPLTPFQDPSDESAMYSSPDRSYTPRSASPATSYGSAPSRAASYSGMDGAGMAKKAPPPPPPSRAKKPPPPPPPPVKRSGLSSAAAAYG